MGSSSTDTLEFTFGSSVGSPHRERHHASLYRLMSPKLQGTIVQQIPAHAKWMRNLETVLNRGRGGLFGEAEARQAAHRQSHVQGTQALV